MRYIYDGGQSARMGEVARPWHEEARAQDPREQQPETDLTPEQHVEARYNDVQFSEVKPKPCRCGNPYTHSHVEPHDEPRPYPASRLQFNDTAA